VEPKGTPILWVGRKFLFYPHTTRDVLYFLSYPSLRYYFFRQHRGKKFDFHGGCDLVLVKQPTFDNGQGLNIHIRTKIQRWWSYIESAVVQIGSDTIEIKGGSDGRKLFWVNGKPGDPTLVCCESRVMPFTIGGHNVRYRVPKDHVFQFKIFLADKQAIVLRSIKEWVSVDIVNPNNATFGSSLGLMGDFQTGAMLGRDGRTRFSDNEDVQINEFGKEWQVHSSEPMLFHSLEYSVQYPEECAMPEMGKETVRRRLGSSSISHAAAKEACADASKDEKDDCINDVMASNDIDMVNVC